MNEDSKFTSNGIDSADLEAEYDFSRATRRNQQHPSSRSIVTIESACEREVKIKTIEVQAIVGEDRTLTIQLSNDITPGEHRIVLLIEESI